MRVFLLDDEAAGLMLRSLRFRRDQMATGVSGIPARQKQLAEVDALFQSLFSQDYAQRMGDSDLAEVVSAIMEMRNEGCY